MLKGVKNEVILEPLEGNFFERKYIKCGDVKLYIAPLDNYLENTDHLYRVYAEPTLITKEGYDIKKGDIVICHHHAVALDKMFSYDGKNLKCLHVGRVFGKLVGEDIIPFGDNIFCNRVKVNKFKGEFAENAFNKIYSNRVVMPFAYRKELSQFINDAEYLYVKSDYPLSSRILKDITIVSPEDIEGSVINIDEYEERNSGYEVKF